MSGCMAVTDALRAQNAAKAEAAADAKALTATDSPPWYYGGYTAPFDLSALVLVLAFGLISAFWTENYGEESPAARHAAGWKRALHPVCRPRPIRPPGASQGSGRSYAPRSAA